MFKKIICFLLHFGNYEANLSLDGNGVKGVHCKKCNADFTVSEKTFKIIVR